MSFLVSGGLFSSTNHLSWVGHTYAVTPNCEFNLLLYTRISPSTVEKLFSNSHLTDTVEIFTRDSSGAADSGLGQQP